MEFTMEISIDSIEKWGKVVAAVRKSQNLDQETAGEFSGSSINTIGKFEKGTGSISLARAFALMEVLGIEVKLDIVLPESDKKANHKFLKIMTDINREYY